MTTLSVLIAKGRTLVDDESFTEEWATELLNEGMKVISNKVKLPDLDTSSEVTATNSGNSVSVPDDYQRGLYRCRVKDSGRDVRVFNSLAQIVEHTGSMEAKGDINCVAVVGKLLYYQGTPDNDVVLVLYYYRKPVPMVDDDDEPDGLPEHFQRSLLGAYVGGEMYYLIEDGVEGATPNTDKYQGRFARLIDELSKELRAGISNPPPAKTRLGL